MPVKAFITEHCTTGLPAFKAASQNLTVLTGLRIHHLSGIRLSVSGYESSYSVLQLPRKVQKNPQDSSNKQHMARGTKEQRYSSCHQHKFIIIIFLLDWNNSKSALKIGFSQCRSTCLKPYHNTEMQHQNLIHVPADRCRAFESSQGCLPRFNTSKLKKKKLIMIIFRQSSYLAPFQTEHCLYGHSVFLGRYRRRLPKIFSFETTVLSLKYSQTTCLTIYLFTLIYNLWLSHLLIYSFVLIFFFKLKLGMLSKLEMSKHPHRFIF